MADQVRDSTAINVCVQHLRCTSDQQGLLVPAGRSNAAQMQPDKHSPRCTARQREAFMYHKLPVLAPILSRTTTTTAAFAHHFIHPTPPCHDSVGMSGRWGVLLPPLACAHLLPMPPTCGMQTQSLLGQQPMTMPSDLRSVLSKKSTKSRENKQTDPAHQK